MKKTFSYALALLLGGCGPHYLIPDSTGRPEKVVVSGYTNNGCIENLYEEAEKQRVRVKLTNVESDLGWGILFWPIYKSYKCTGDVVNKASRDRPEPGS
jgi:hypothetical protein